MLVGSCWGASNLIGWSGCFGIDIFAGQWTGNKYANNTLNIGFAYQCPLCLVLCNIALLLYIYVN